MSSSQLISSELDIGVFSVNKLRFPVLCPLHMKTQIIFSFHQIFKLFRNAQIPQMSRGWNYMQTLIFDQG